MDNNYLQHYGILGMKWGVRRSKNQLAKSSKTRRSKTDNWSDDAKEVSKLKKKKVSEMTNAELRKFNERMNLERQYSQLTQKEKNAGAKFCSDLLRETGKEIAKAYISKYAKQGIEALIKKAATRGV